MKLELCPEEVEDVSDGDKEKTMTDYKMLNSHRDSTK
jgi:hypothetical protein